MVRGAWWAVGLFAMALALRVGVCAAKGTLGRSPERGYREYVVTGQRLLEHGTLVSPLIIDDVDRQPSALMPPAYVGLVGAVYWLLGVETFAATLTLQMINVAAGALCVVLAFGVASELLDRRAGYLAGTIAAVNPTLIGYTDLIWDTYLFALGVVTTVWMAMRLGDPPLSPLIKGGGEDRPVKRGAILWLGYGLWLGALAHLNPALTAAYPVLVLWPIARRKGRDWRNGIRFVALAVAGWLVAVAPWTIRNYVQLGELLYIRSGLPVQVWLGVCPEADPGGGDAFKGQFPLNNEEVQRHVAQIGEQAFVRECGERAKQAIRKDPWRFVRLGAIRALDYWAGTTLSHPASDHAASSGRALRRVVTCFLAAESIVIVLCLLGQRRVGQDVIWLLVTVLSFSVVYFLTHVQVRFRAPIEPVMAVLVGVAAVRALDRIPWIAGRDMRE